MADKKEAAPRRKSGAAPTPRGLRSSTRKIAGFGWKPDLPDQRDLTYSVPHAISKNIPPRIDLRRGCPPVYDQGRIGSCTANAIAAALEFDVMKQGIKPVFTPSRLFIYYNERAIEGTVGSDFRRADPRRHQERRQRGRLPGKRVAL